MESTSQTSQDVDMTLCSDVEPVRPEIPARLSARAFNKANSRRKSSAPSSRRSSLSSIHSHSSALSCPAGPKGTHHHLAQHLRRASIIESRKARLADRAAYAEQVRLRAAAARAAQRGCHEEKAMAAYAAREKLLAEITARCEEEVRRAKKVAEDTKEKKAAELARLKEGMADKLAEAARRKSIYQQEMRRPRAASLAAVDDKKTAPAAVAAVRHDRRLEAAATIQRAWRLHQTQTLARDFADLDLDLRHASSLSFEQLTRLLSSDRTICVATALLRRLGPLDDTAEEAGAARVFLSAYLVLAHPTEAFSHGGALPPEQELKTKAAALITSFDSCLVWLASGRRCDLPIAYRELLLFSYNDFTTAFHAWKSQDLEVLVDIMLGSFVHLDLIIQVTQNDRDGCVAQDYLEAIRQEQVKLLARLKRLLGPQEALDKVKAAVRQARRQHAAERGAKGLGYVPRFSPPIDHSHPAGAPLTPPATPQSYRSESDPGTSSLAATLDQIMTVLPSNREIAHEIQVNGRFEVQQRPWTDARKTLMESLRANMRTSMCDADSEATARWTHTMAVLIRDKLMNLIHRKHPLYERLDGFLDPALILQQCRQGMFSYNDFFATMSTLIAQLCSPGRDDVVKQFAADTTSDTIDRLFDLINVIDLMTLDHINFQFRLAAVTVLERGHEHEMASFERDLQRGIHTLEKTTQWWTRARSNTAAPAVNANQIYARGLTDLVLGNTPLSIRDVPETLELDYLHLLRWRARVFHLIATSSILLTTKIRLRRNRGSLWTNDANRLMALDMLTTDIGRVVSLLESSHLMPDSTKEGLSNFIGRVLPPAAAAARHATAAEQDRQEAINNQAKYNPTGAESQAPEGHDVFAEQIASFLLKSLREHVYARLSASGTAERVRLASGAAELMTKVGMPEFVQEVAQLTHALERIKAVDLKAHGKWYDQVAATLG